jgi:hypothetical protein
MTMLLVSGCEEHYTPPESPMPPNTVLLSQMMRELSAQPGFTEAVIQQITGAAEVKRGPTLLTPKLVDELRKLIFGRDWADLDRFPGWKMGAITRSVGVIDRIVNGHVGGSGPANNPGHPGTPDGGLSFLDLGSYGLEQEQTVSLDGPSEFPPFTTEGLISELGYHVERGDGPNEFAPEHAESARLAEALNRLAANALDGAKPFRVKLNGDTAATPEQLITALLSTGHQITVVDARYFANFGHLHYNGQDVMMPFWINTGFAVPQTGAPLRWGARPLLIPVSHAEYEWEIRAPKNSAVHGPRINADISYYFGIDGKSEWRTMDTLDQAWVLKRIAHSYTGANAVEITRLASLLTVAYMHQHQRRPNLPFGGYYTLGVCQDGVAAIEKHMTGNATLFPNTADITLFDDPRDAEVNALLSAIPTDRNGGPVEPERIFGSLPAGPGVDGRFSAITIPGLASDLAVSYAAWQDGKLRRMHSRGFYWVLGGVAFAGAAALFAVGVFRRVH